MNRAKRARGLFPWIPALLGVAGLGAAVLGEASSGVILLALAGILSAVSAERRRRRAEVAEARVERDDLLFSAAGQGVAVRDADGRWVASPRFVDLVGAEDEAGIEKALNEARGGIPEAIAATTSDGGAFRLDAATRAGRPLRVSGRREAGRVLLTVEGDGERRAEVERARIELAAARVDAGAARGEARVWRAVFDAAPIPLWLRDADGRIIHANPAFVRAVDAVPGEAISSARDVLPHGESRDLAERARRLGSATRERATAVSGGDRRILDVTETRIGADTRDFATVGTSIDRTAEEKAKSDLKRLMSAQSEVLERINTAVALFGPDTRLTFFNPSYARLWGLDEAWLRTEPTHAELLEELRTKRMLPETTDFRTFKRERLALYTKLMDAHEELMHLPDGTALRVLATPHPTGGLIMAIEDVTGALAMESSFNTLMAVREEILDNLSEGVAVVGGDGRVKFHNRAFLRLWDLREEDLRGEPHITDIVDRLRPLLVPSGGEENDDAWEILREEMIAAILERSVRSGRMERADGSVIEFSTSPLPDGATLSRWVDVTDEARLAEALSASTASIESADMLKSEFISVVSRHLRTPLNGMIGFAEVLADEYFGTLNERQLEYVKGIIQSGGRLLEVLGDIVDLSSVGAGMTDIDQGEVDMSAVVDAVVGLTREWARGEGVRLDTDVDRDLGVVDGDSRRLKQALFTLAVTTLRATRRDGHIALSAKRVDDWIEIIVGDTPADSGIGSIRRRDTVVDGLGLTLVRAVVEGHGGALAIEGAPGRLARVRCRLPVRASETVVVDEITPSEPPQSTP